MCLYLYLYLCVDGVHFLSLCWLYYLSLLSNHLSTIRLLCSITLNAPLVVCCLCDGWAFVWVSVPAPLSLSRLPLLFHSFFSSVCLHLYFSVSTSSSLCLTFHQSLSLSLCFSLSVSLHFSPLPFSTMIISLYPCPHLRVSARIFFAGLVFQKEYILTDKFGTY